MDEVDRECAMALDEGEVSANRDVCPPLHRTPMSDEEYRRVGDQLAYLQKLGRENANFVRNLIEGEMAFRPMTDRVVVFAIEAPEGKKVDGTDKTIYTPDTVREDMRTARGIVAGIGPGRHLDDGSVEPIPLELGDLVQFGRFAGQRMEAPHERPEELEGIVMIILRLSEIHGVWVPRQAAAEDAAMNTDSQHA